MSRLSSILLIVLVIAFAVTRPLVAPAEDEAPTDNASVLQETPIDATDRQHWAFAPLLRTSPPTVPLAFDVDNTIDAYVAHELQQLDLKLQPEADRATLLRRLSFDLTGLPPTPTEQTRFLSDTAPDAYERVVDRLLASPEFGRRWAQHWLELARYAETDGFEHDKVRANAWRYRDWVIDALNRNTPYSQFIALQIAGDRIRPGDPTAAWATGFCTSAPDMPDINSMDERRHNLMNEITSTVGSALLGLQIGCAQCHDHKYDPISQADFYRLRAYFDSSLSLKRNQSIAFLQDTSKPAASRVMVRGDWRRPGPEVKPATPRIARQTKTESTPRTREHLAAWLSRMDNPLATRVFVNRIWQHHFGRGLSDSPSDFGVMGDEPVSPALLDHLVDQMVDSGGDVKALHRAIVTSSAYRQRSYLPDTANERDKAEWARVLKTDPDNDYCSRFPRRRLDGESIRDALLQISGELNREGGGPGVRPPLPSELKSTLLRNQWVESKSPSDHVRRSIFVFARRNLRYPIFEAFDRPDGNASCPRRNQSTTAPQSLMLLNGRLSLSLAKTTAVRLTQAPHASTADRLKAAFRLILNRPPTLIESTAAARFLKMPEGESPSEQRWTDLCLALFNANAFVYVD